MRCLISTTCICCSFTGTIKRDERKYLDTDSTRFQFQKKSRSRHSKNILFQPKSIRMVFRYKQCPKPVKCPQSIPKLNYFSLIFNTILLYLCLTLYRIKMLLPQCEQGLLPSSFSSTPRSNKRKKGFAVQEPSRVVIEL